MYNKQHVSKFQNFMWWLGKVHKVLLVARTPPDGQCLFFMKHTTDLQEHLVPSAYLDGGMVWLPYLWTWPCFASITRPHTVLFLVQLSPVIDLIGARLKAEALFLVRNKTLSCCYTHTKPNVAILFRLDFREDPCCKDKFGTLCIFEIYKWC